MLLRKESLRNHILPAVVIALLFLQTAVSNAAQARRARGTEPAFGGGRNIIRNGGFEEGATGWTLAKGQVLLTGSNTAHSGTACVRGEVAGDRQALQLVRTIAVRKGYLYRYEVWARATNGGKMTVFVVQPGRPNRQRKTAGTFLRIPRQWRRYEGIFAAEATGDLQLQIIAPTSHGAPPCRMWVDDVAVYEFRTSEPTSVTNGAGFNDEPSMVRTGDGSLYVAWVSFRDGFDSLRLARFRRQGETFQQQGAWQIVGGKNTYVLWPRVVAARDGAYLLYAAEVKGNWDVYAVACGPEGPGRTVRVSSHAAVDTKPVGAWRDGTLWIAWESNRDAFRQIFVASLEDGQDTNVERKARRLSAARVCSYDPSIVALGDGQICAAWHSFADNNFDVFLRRRSSRGRWHREERLTRAPSIDRHARLFSRDAELWLAYENAQMSSYMIGSARDKRLVVARVGSRGLEIPANEGKPSPLWEGGEAAAPAFDASGRLWVAYMRGSGKVWRVLLAGHNGRRWGAAGPVTMLRGMDRPPSLFMDGARAILAFQADDIAGSYPSRDASLKSKSDIYLVAHDVAGAEPPAAAPLEPLAERDEAFEPGTLRVAYGEDSKPMSIKYQGQTLNLFYGNLHDHTEVSVCNRLRDESINEAYQDMRDITRCDFACVTDHGYNLSPYLWSYTAKMARSNDDPGRFLTFLAEEWTSTFEEYSDKHPYGFYGHRNLIFADSYFPRWWNARNYQTPAQVWEDLRKMKANFVHIPHQLADTGNVPVDWDYADERAQPVAEIFQVRGSYEYKGAPREAKRTTPEKGPFLQDAWARGLVIGVIASPDHGGGMGKACVYAPELTRESILDALRARHCYGTTAAKIFLDVRVNGALMGEKIPAARGRPVEVEVSVRCPGEIERIEVCRSNKFIYTRKTKGRRADFTYVDETPLEDASFYYVRVIQEDQEIAWSSPVWLGAE